MDEKNKIAIIGVGQLGSRHLQGLASISRPTEIYVVDPCEESLIIAEARYFEVRTHLNNDVVFLKRISDLPQKLDLVIIATTSSVRRHIIEELLRERKIDYFILEKVVFQKPIDFLPVKHLFKKSGSLAWVNCTRRAFSFYSDVKRIVSNDIIMMTITGNKWGLACNSIHFIDLFVFLTDQGNLSFTKNELKNEIYDSKRPGFKELRGAFEVKTPRGDWLRISEKESEPIEFEITISTETMEFVISEAQGIATRYENNSLTELKVSIPFQSQLTGQIADQIVQTGVSMLTPFDECLDYHIPMLEFFNKHFSKLTGSNIKECPIT